MENTVRREIEQECTMVVNESNGLSYKDEQCITWLAVEHNSTRHCESIQMESLRNACYRAVAEKYNDIGACFSTGGIRYPIPDCTQLVTDPCQ